MRPIVAIPAAGGTAALTLALASLVATSDNPALRLGIAALFTLTITAGLVFGLIRARTTQLGGERQRRNPS